MRNIALICGAAFLRSMSTGMLGVVLAVYLSRHGLSATWIGAVIAAYGAIYFGFHDVIVHRRIAHRYVPRSNYMKRIVQAHRIHHAVTTKHGTVSFGFLWAPAPRGLKARLKSNRSA